MYENLMLQIIEKTSKNSGNDFFRTLVLALNDYANFDYAFVGKINNEDWSVQTVALATKNNIQENFQYSLYHTPCERILNQDYCRFADNVCVAFPKDYLLQDMSIEGYVGYPLMSSNGKPIGILVLMQQSPIKNVDASFDLLRFFARRCENELERIYLEKCLEHTEGELIKASSVRESILQNISHEMRTPLNAIIGFSELLNSKDLLDLKTVNVKEYLSYIKTAGEELLESITSLADFSSLRSGQYSPKISVQEIGGLIEKTIKHQKDRHPSILFNYSANTTSIYAEMDGELLEKVLMALLDNAAKFSPPRSKVTTTALVNDEQHLQILIVDTGCGFEQKDLDYLQRSLSFDDDVLSKEVSGLGLGLAFVKYSCQLLNITVEYQSEITKGTSVTLTIPVAER